jgi:hypothetical protein
MVGDVGIARRLVEGPDLIVTVWDGLVTAAEWADTVQSQVTDPNHSLSRRRLTDARTADSSNITEADVAAISTSYANAGVALSGVKLAIVANEGWATAQQVEAGMNNLGVTTVVFSDVHTACIWLGVDPGPAVAAINELRRELRGPLPDGEASE